MNLTPDEHIQEMYSRLCMKWGKLMDLWSSVRFKLRLILC